MWGRLLVTGRVVGRVVDGRVVAQDGPGQQDKQISDRSPTFLVLAGSPAQPRSPGVGEVHSVVESARLRGCAATLGMPARA